MKVVINKCFGGFGLSKAAILELANQRCVHIKRLTPFEYFGGDRFPDWKKEFNRLKAGNSLTELIMVDDQIIIDEHDYQGDNARACPALVSVVEHLQQKANGMFAKLKVVEIPDGIEFAIEDYDGQESIHQVHQSWG